MIRYLILMLFLLAACGRSESTTRTPTSLGDRLQERRATYLQLLPEVQDDSGFVDTDQCDSLLHSALLAAGGVHVDLGAARNSDGQWFRRPLNYQECLSSGSSKSTLSRDMVIGLMWAWYMEKDVASAEDFYQYVSARTLKMGESDGSPDGISRVYMTPYLMGLLSEVIYELGGPNHIAWRVGTGRGNPAVTGFEAHLHTLTTLLYGRVTGYYMADELAFIQAQVARMPENALFQYAAAHTDEAARLLLAQHPADHLPTSAEICDSLPYQRDSIGPCINSTTERTYAPVHFLFLEHLIVTQKGA